MSHILLKSAVHLLFACTSRSRVARRCDVLSREYEILLEGFTKDSVRQGVRVPKMKGVDEDMRDWSFYDVLEHNVIVNRRITAIVCKLASGGSVSDLPRIDPKKDVMPIGSFSDDVFEVFLDSLARHRSSVEGLGSLRGGGESRHPVFGMFDAHKWNCMFTFHLGLHLAQARSILKLVSSE